ncbi:hypothetical protein [Parageobacillus galactosidasius]|jgi:hypothetical protein|uniref:Uncharacterized protein n=1 Tax=Parageobacillus galactosidasius TaxID=883812 RepID=A0A226QKY4_9BACL|nr:hypothetical protein [Parageobacillus galactosidasius]OXB92347.1 hypothetical protein B9L23_14210 [Parageobacillus galactosidasius]
MKKYLGIISFVLIISVIVFWGITLASIINLEVSTFRALMITGIILSLLFAILSEKGFWKRISIVLGILVGLFYFFGIEVMRILLQGNGF